MPAKSRCYYMMVGLLYPSALGAALAWLVPAVWEMRAYHGASGAWTIAFAVWFVVYHSIWFVYLLRATDRGGYAYGPWACISDLLGVVAIFLAFAGLGLATAHYSLQDPWPVYLAALLVPGGAAIDRSRARNWDPFVLILLGFPAGLALWGLMARRPVPEALATGDWFRLTMLWVLLILYVWVPEIFNSFRAKEGATV